MLSTRGSSLWTIHVVRVCVCACMRMYAYVCVCMRMYAYVCVCMRMYAYVCVCMRMYVCVRARARACVRACVRDTKSKINNYACIFVI